MLKFTRIQDAGCPTYDVVLGDEKLARIEQRDHWELPTRRVRWALDLPTREARGPVTFYYDTLAEAKDGVACLLVNGLEKLVRETPPHHLRRQAGVAD